jgi:CheY-like chemotaxis protein
MSLTILLAEDDPGHATLIRRNLARAGVGTAVVHVADGQQALDYMNREGAFAGRPDVPNLVMLLDVNMPRVDGFEVLRRVKADPATAPVPVVLLTTTDDPRDVARGYALGCCAYVVKTLRSDAFSDAVRKLGLFLGVVRAPAAEPAA